MTVLVSRVEACKRLGVSRGTFEKLQKAGAIPLPLANTRKYVWPNILAGVTGAPVEREGPAGTASARAARGRKRGV
jgi:hypothetical protein